MCWAGLSTILSFTTRNMQERQLHIGHVDAFRINIHGGHVQVLLVIDAEFTHFVGERDHDGARTATRLLHRDKAARRDPGAYILLVAQRHFGHHSAVIIHGNTLSLEEFGRWYTPAHIMDGWTWKLPREPEGGRAVEGVPESQKPQRPGADDKGQPPRSQLTLF
jgi:hypothetical protein